MSVSAQETVPSPEVNGQDSLKASFLKIQPFVELLGTPIDDNRLQVGSLRVTLFPAGSSQAEIQERGTSGYANSLLEPRGLTLRLRRNSSEHYTLGAPRSATTDQAGVQLLNTLKQGLRLTPWEQGGIHDARPSGNQVELNEFDGLIVAANEHYWVATVRDPESGRLIPLDVAEALEARQATSAGNGDLALADAG